MKELFDAFNVFLPNGNSASSFLKAKRCFRGGTGTCRRIDMCVNDCVLFYDSPTNPLMRHAAKDSCPECHEPRYCHGSQRVPRKQFYYISLIEQLRSLFLDHHMGELLRFTKARRQDGVWEDMTDSDGFWEAYQLDGFNQDSRNQSMVVSTDGINPFRHVQHSMWPITTQV
jgi:hypothetical protein